MDVLERRNDPVAAMLSGQPAAEPDVDIEQDDAFSYDGYQVVRGEFFAHIYEPPQDCVLSDSLRVCHKSVTHPFLFFSFSQIRNLKKHFYLQQSPNFHKLGLCLSAKDLYFCRKLL